MTKGDIIRLLLLGAIWGSSFLFMRVLAPAIGPLMTVEIRLLISGLALLAGFAAFGYNFEVKKYWKQYAIIGAINCVVPFNLYAYASLHIPASCMAILNSTTPMFGVIFSALWLGDKLTPNKILGLLMGSSGVALVAGAGATAAGIDSHYIPASIACLIGSACYAIAVIYIKRHAQGIKPVGVATCSQLAAVIILLPTFAAFPPIAQFTPAIIGCLLMLSLVCSAIAYLLYFRLVESGASKALTVTFLVPGFGMVWGALFLNEQVTPAMLAGCVLILLGTASVVGLFRKPAAST